MINELTWLDPADRIQKDQWVLTKRERLGSTPLIRWHKNSVTGECALFKPDTLSGNEAYHEYVAYRICKHLQIPCARIAVGNIGDEFGCLSYDVYNAKRYRVVDGESLYLWDVKMNSAREESKSADRNSITGLSLEGLLPFLNSNTERELVDMLFIDCLVKNVDRHGGNFAYYVGVKNMISGIVPLYDHGMCLRDDLRDVAIFCYSKDFEQTFDEVFADIAKHYLVQITDLYVKASSPEFKELLNTLGCAEFILPRLLKFARHLIQP